MDFIVHGVTKSQTQLSLGFPDDSAGKESACNAGDLGSIPGLGRSLGEGKGYPLQYSGLENSMDCTIHGVTRVGHDCVTFTLLTFEGSYHLFSAQPLRMLSDI